MYITFPFLWQWPMEKTTSLLILGKQSVCPSHDVPSVLQEKYLSSRHRIKCACVHCPASLGFMPLMITQSTRIALISFLCLSHLMSHPLCLPLPLSSYGLTCSIVVVFFPRASIWLCNWDNNENWLDNYSELCLHRWELFSPSLPRDSKWLKCAEFNGTFVLCWPHTRG